MGVPVSSEINLDGKTALITGSARGIGLSAAVALAREGANVALADILPLEQSIEEVRGQGTKVEGYYCDVTKENDVKQLVESVVNDFGSIDILVTCAGICLRTPILDISEEEWDKVLSVNLKGTFLCCKEAYRYMRERKSGKIVCVGSIAGKVGGVISGPHYVASKAGIHGFIKWLAKDAAPYGIYVNAIAPGPVETEMTKGFPYYPEMSPLKRLGQPEDIAEAVVFLASQSSNWITGLVLDVNGGML